VRFRLFDKNEIYKGNLTNILKAEREEELNGKHILETTILNKEDNAEYIEKKGRLLYKDRLGNWQEFIIRGITSPHEDTITMDLYCENSIYELWGDYIEDRRPQNTTANIALGVALEGTRFEVGIVDDLGVSSTNFYHIFAKEAVNKVAETWNCEIRVRIVVVGNEVTHRYIDLLKRRGAYRGKRYEYSKDLLSITKTVHNDDPVTALYGYGKGEQIGDGYGRRIDFKNVEWSKANGDPLDKPLGQTYISDPNVLQQWGRPNGNGSKTHVFDKVDYDDTEDENQLIIDTYEEYLKRSKLQISYEGKVINLRETEGSEHEGVELGDDVGVIDKEYRPAIRVFARVLRYKEDLLDATNDDVTLANFIKDITSRLKENKKFIDNFRDKSGAWDKADFFDKDGLPSQYLKNLIDELNTKMNTTGGYTYFREGKGIEILNKPEDMNPTESMMLGGGYIAIADSKLPNGEFDYKTFGTGAGFTADLIRTGILQGGKVKFDLTNGTLLIGNSVDDYSLLFDGNSLKIRLSNGKTIEQEITDVTNEVTSVKSRTASLETNVNSITGRVSSTETNIGTINGNITSLDSRLDSAELKITPTAITSTVESNTTTLVNKTSIISVINQTAETIRIQASKINLVGAVTVLSDITGNLGTLTAGTLKGVTIISQVGTNRIEIVGDTLTAYKNDKKSIRFINKSMEFWDWSTGKMTNILSSSNYGSDRYGTSMLLYSQVNRHTYFDISSVGTYNETTGSWTANNVGFRIQLNGNNEFSALFDLDYPLEMLNAIDMRNNNIVNIYDISAVEYNVNYSLRFNFDRTWEFKELSSGSSSALGLICVSGGKRFLITDPQFYSLFSAHPGANGSTGIVKVTGNFEVTGSKNSLIRTENYGDRLLYAEESTTAYFRDYIKLKLNSGKHTIQIDKMFLETISSYYVIPVVRNRAKVYIVEENKDKFVVEVEGTADVVFIIQGVRRGYENIYMEESNIEDKSNNAKTLRSMPKLFKEKTARQIKERNLPKNKELMT